MLARLPWLTVAFAARAAGDVISRCATSDLPIENLADNAKFAAEEAEARSSLAAARLSAPEPIVIPTVFHVVSSSDRPEDGYLSVSTNSACLRLVAALFS